MCFLQFRSGKNNHSQAANPATHFPRKIKQATNGKFGFSNSLSLQRALEL